ncbi:MAG: PAS domain-containing protein [Caldilineaceae bacterium]
MEIANYGALHARMVERYAPPSVLVNRDYNMVHISAHAGRYLQQPGGEPTNNMLQRVRDELRIELTAALYGAFEKGRSVRTQPTRMRLEGEAQLVCLTVRAPSDPEMADFVLVIFEEYDPAETNEQQIGMGVVTTAAGEQQATGLQSQDQRDATVRDLEEELQATKQRLRTTIEEFETSKEEMRASNEELQSMNEELKSTAEELETSHEELQSMNEELVAVNQENRNKVEELAQLSSDLRNLLDATDIATLFLDRELRIMRFTPRVGELFNILPTDRGRALGDLTHKLGYDGLLDDARAVLRRLAPIEREINAGGERWHLMRILPYRTVEDRIDGVVITFAEISAQKAAEQIQLQARKHAEDLIDSMPDPVLVLNTKLRVATANQTFYDYFQVTPAQSMGALVYELGNGQWNIPQLRQLLEDVLPANNSFSGYEVEHTFEAIGHKTLRLSGQRLDHMQLIVLGMHDITELKAAEETLRQNAGRDAFRAALLDALRALADPVAIQAAACRLLGEHLGVDRAYYVEVDEATGQARVHQNYLRGDSPSLVGAFPLAEVGWTVPYLRRDEVVVVADTQTDAMVPDADRGWMADLQMHAHISMPIVKEGALMGALCVTEPAPRAWTELEVELMRESAARLWDAIIRAETEAALRQSENRLQQMINVEGVGILLFREDGTLIWANDAFLTMHGYSRAEVETGAMSWRDLTPPEDVAVSEEQMAKLTQSGRIGPYEKEYLRKDGARAWMLFAGAGLGDGTIVEYCVDISRRKQAEAALRRYEERYRVALQHSPVMLAGVDRELRYLWIVNSHPDFDADGVVGKRDVEIEDAPGNIALAALKQRAFEQEEPQQQEITFSRSDGDRTYTITATPLRDEAGRIESVVTTAFDITEHRHMEDALRTSATRLHAMANAAPAMVFIADARGTITFHNQRWLEYTGLTPEENAEAWAQVVHPDDVERIVAAWSQAIAQGAEYEIETRNRRYDGVYRWFLARATPIRDAGGQVIEWYGSAIDIQEQKETEEALRRLTATLEEQVVARTAQARELAAQLTMVEQEERQRLAHILHDDLQQRLYGIQMKLTMADATIQENNLDSARQELGEAAEWLRTCITLTRQLSVDLSPPILSHEDLADALRWLARQIQDIHGLEVELIAGHSFSVENLEKRLLLYQAVRELLFNVVKYAEVTRATVIVRKENGDIVIQVADDGRGFDVEAESTQNRQDGGLGLYSIGERLNLFGGEMAIDSAPGEGTRITLRAPFG